MNNWQRFLHQVDKQHRVAHVSDGSQFGLSPRLLRSELARQGWREPHQQVLVDYRGGITFQQRAYAGVSLDR